MATATVTALTNATPSSTPIPSRPASTTPAVLCVPQSMTDDARPSPTLSIRSSLSWKSIRSTINVSERTSAQLGWAVAFISVLLTIVTLSPAFKSQTLSEKALQLAEWTALKDYIEECREEIAAGIQSQACLRAMNTRLPPPPYVKAGALDKARRRESVGETWVFNATAAPRIEELELRLPTAVQGLMFMFVVLTACVFLVVSFESSRSRVFGRVYTQPEKTTEGLNRQPEPREPTTSSVTRHPPSHSEASVRRRPIRNHPIYRHANLEEAIHEEDLAEIRTRLWNGEDVNQHWPYLIYRLAITPKIAVTASRLEVARLCLDFGADVNALKGWNGQSALMIAIHFGNVDVAKLLIANGATVCYSPADSNLTALHRCVRLAVTGSATDALAIMEMLFKHGADANQADRIGETSLHKLLIDAWYSRDDEMAMKDLYPVGLCLLDHGACIPETIKEKFIVDNPLWDFVHRASGRWSGRSMLGQIIQ
ncbi:ankyrin [Pleomassaria siparia CBS 279.74]|uniref:Ankyrin n=1 Tax=Pleomassaria siparia CBS 279.74 TaxID=1314801 RepID=A0A6G1K4X0_9PLEO|nr:ankyrin [Pleomassaria siparia CBS 279.74]